MPLNILSITEMVRRLWIDGEVYSEGKIGDTRFEVPHLREIARGSLEEEFKKGNFRGLEKEFKEFNWIIAIDMCAFSNPYTSIALYPEDKYSHVFFEENIKIRENGYKERFPGAIAALEYRKKNEAWSIIGLQNLYILPLSEEISIPYKIAGNLLLGFFFGRAEKANVPYVDYSVLTERIFNLKAKQEKVERVGNRYGYYFMQIEKDKESEGSFCIEKLVLKRS
jgi:hypothetical protein